MRYREGGTIDIIISCTGNFATPAFALIRLLPKLNRVRAVVRQFSYPEPSKVVAINTSPCSR